MPGTVSEDLRLRCELYLLENPDVAICELLAGWVATWHEGGGGSTSITRRALLDLLDRLDEISL